MFNFGAATSRRKFLTASVRDSFNDTNQTWSEGLMSPTTSLSVTFLNKTSLAKKLRLLPAVSACTKATQ